MPGAVLLLFLNARQTLPRYAVTAINVAKRPSKPSVAKQSKHKSRPARPPSKPRRPPRRAGAGGRTGYCRPGRTVARTPERRSSSSELLKCREFESLSDVRECV